MQKLFFQKQTGFCWTINFDYHKRKYDFLVAKLFSRKPKSEEVKGTWLKYLSVLKPEVKLVTGEFIEILST